MAYQAREAHCRSCRCHESPAPVPVKPGDRVGNRSTGETGIVLYTQEANLPWHHGGGPFVEADGSGELGYWHYYDLLEKAQTHES